jgi:hypothetical protein
MATKKKHIVEADHNEDPITGEHGAHPVGAGAGAALGGAAAGAAAGFAGGPVGAVAGAVIGGVAGGLAGKAIAEQIDPTVEYAYWETEYENRPYYDSDTDYESFAPAYRHGWEGRSRYPDRTFDSAEAELRREWEASPYSEELKWDQARHATRDAWDRVDQTVQRPKNPR